MNIGKLLKEAQRIQAEIAKMQEEIANTKFEATAGGGAVKVVVTGNLNPVEVKIDEEILKEADPEMLEDLLLAALNEAIEKAKTYTQEKMSEITGGMGGPSLPGFPGGLA